jgi:hypothetical protein
MSSHDARDFDSFGNGYPAGESGLFPSPWYIKGPLQTTPNVLDTTSLFGKGYTYECLDDFK